MAHILEFKGYDGCWIAIKRDNVDAILEHGSGCTIVTTRDTHRVTADYQECLDKVWPRKD